MGVYLPARNLYSKPLIKMESQRQLKFARLIQKDLSEIFARDLHEITGNAMVTITAVKVSPDLGVASVYLSFMLAKNQQMLMDDISDNNKKIRQILAAKIRNQVRVIPELRFFIDDTAEEAAKIEKLLSSLNIPKEEGK